MGGSRDDEKVREGMGAIVHDGGVAFRVWAPHAEAVFVTGSFNDWAEDAAPMALEDEDGGDLVSRRRGRGGGRRVPLPDRAPATRRCRGSIPTRGR